MDILVSSVSKSEGNVDSQNEELFYKLKVTLSEPQRQIVDVWIAVPGLWCSLFPVFICKEFFVFTQLSCHQHEANLS